MIYWLIGTGDVSLNVVDTSTIFYLASLGISLLMFEWKRNKLRKVERDNERQVESLKYDIDRLKKDIEAKDVILRHHKREKERLVYRSQASIKEFTDSVTAAIKRLIDQIEGNSPNKT